MMELLTDPKAWIAFFTLTALELVLGIDNVIFISILVDKLEKERREFARKLGLFLAMFMRIGLLLVLSWIVGLTAPFVCRARQRDFRQGPDSHCRRSVFDLEKHGRNSTNCWKGRRAMLLPPWRRFFQRSFFKSS